MESSAFLSTPHCSRKRAFQASFSSNPTAKQETSNFFLSSSARSLPYKAAPAATEMMLKTFICIFKMILQTKQEIIYNLYSISSFDGQTTSLDNHRNKHLI